MSLALVGPLGAGKTVFVKGLAEGLGVDPRLVSSPTFVIAQQYPVAPVGRNVDTPPETETPSQTKSSGADTGGPAWLHHVDLYRLDSEAELESIGFYDLMAPGCVLAVEWADRFPDVLGPHHLAVTFSGPTASSTGAADGVAETQSQPGRTIGVRAAGELARAVSTDWSQRATRLESGQVAARGAAATASRAEMRLLLCGLLASGLLLGDTIAGSRTGRMDAEAVCAGFVPLETDALGTRRARCLTRAETTSAELAGLGRLLTGGRMALDDATPELLERLPGIGPVRARAIVQTRRERGFAQIADLERVPGIGPRIRARLARWLRIARPPIGPASGSFEDG